MKVSVRGRCAVRAATMDRTGKRCGSHLSAPRITVKSRRGAIWLPSLADLNSAYVHLHVHSSYSLLEGALTIARLAELAKKDRQPALALTDTDNMFGSLEFSEKMAGYGIQPIVGCALGVDFGDQEVRSRRHRRCLAAYRAASLAREEGYRSLMRLCSRAYLETSAAGAAAHQARLA